MTTPDAPATTGTEPYALTNEDVAALRLADSLAFYHYEGRDYIRAWLRGGYSGNPRIFTRREQQLFPDTHDPQDRERRISCTGSVYGYTPDGEHDWTDQQHPDVSCYEPGVGGRYLATWATLASLIKPGDRLALKWIADIHERLTRDYRLHCDTLHLVITRGKRVLTFLLSDRVSPDNSARMIRRTT